jgi:hypothetical protein
MTNVEGMTKHENAEAESGASLFVIRHSSFVICAESALHARPIYAPVRVSIFTISPS